MRGHPYRIRAVEEYWWHTETLSPEAYCEKTRVLADAAVGSLESALKRMQDSVIGKGLVEAGLSLEELELIACGKQNRIIELENLLHAAYETYADDGFLVTKDEWLESLLLLVKEQEKS